MVQSQINEYKILRFANSILQGQFRKYSSIVIEVAVRCVKYSNSFEEAKEMFNNINLAVSRILSTGAEFHNLKDINEDNPEILNYTQKLNESVNMKKLWTQLKIMGIGKTVIAVNNQTGTQKTGKIVNLNYGIEVNFGDEIIAFSNKTWNERVTDTTKTSDFFTIQEIF